MNLDLPCRERRFATARRHALDGDDATAGDEQGLIEVVDGRADVSRKKVEQVAERWWPSAFRDLDGQVFLARTERAQFRTTEISLVGTPMSAE